MKLGSYIEAVLEVCDEHEIEPESGAKLLSRPIKEKLEVEGTNRNLLKKKPSLDM